MIWLGIDGGGSKTRLLLVDDNDVELARIETGPSNWSSVGPAIARESLSTAILKLRQKPDVVCAGFAGAGRPEAAAFYRDALHGLLPNAAIIVETDALIAYTGAIGLGPGVLLIAGTGSIALARSDDGKLFRVGGWGPVFGDEGSGYWIGQQAVRTALRSQDFGEYPEFTRSIVRALGMSDITEVITAWASSSLGVPSIAALAAEVIGQYPAGPAQKILDEAAAHLRELVKGAMKRASLTQCTTSIVGSIGANPLIQRLIGTPFTPPVHPPERGAILWARQVSRNPNK